MQGDNDLGRAIQVRRAELGLKRKDLARHASLSYPYLSELENGLKAPSARALAQLAHALELSPAELLARAETMAPPAPAARDMPSSSMDTSSPVPELWKRLSTAVDASREASARPAVSVADNALLDRIAGLVAVTVRAELNAWARNELPALVREELSRLVEQAERDDS
jgi:transcriptional regulator with XRE-family HTH domain